MTYYHGRWCDPGETISSIMVLGAPIVGEGNAPPVIVSFSGLAIVKGLRGHLFHGDREVSSTEVKAGALISLRRLSPDLSSVMYCFLWYHSPPSPLVLCCHLGDEFVA